MSNGGTSMVSSGGTPSAAVAPVASGYSKVSVAKYSWASAARRNSTSCWAASDWSVPSMIEIGEAISSAPMSSPDRRWLREGRSGSSSRNRWL